MNKDQSNLKNGILLVVTASIFWGISTSLIIPHLYSYPVTFVVFVMHLFPLVILTVFYPKEYKNFFKLSKSDMTYAAIIALLAGVIGTLLIVKALFLVDFKYLSAVVLIQKVQPVFAIILAALFLKEKIKFYFIIIAVIVFAGVYFMSFGFHMPYFAVSSTYLLAYMLTVIAAFFFSTNTVLGKYLTNTVSNKTITFARFFLGTIFSLIICLTVGDIHFISKLNSASISFFIVNAIIAGPFVMFLYYIGLKKIKAIFAALGELALPFSVIILDYFYYGETLSYVQGVGGGIIIIGIICLTYMQNKEENKFLINQ